MQTAQSVPPLRANYSSGPEGLGYAIWEFDGQAWQLKKNCAVQGATVSAPPEVPGKFKGQLRSTACIVA